MPSPQLQTLKQIQSEIAEQSRAIRNIITYITQLQLLIEWLEGGIVIDNEEMQEITLILNDIARQFIEIEIKHDSDAKKDRYDEFDLKFNDLKNILNKLKTYLNKIKEWVELDDSRESYGALDNSESKSITDNVERTYMVREAKNEPNDDIEESKSEGSYLLTKYISLSEIITEDQLNQRYALQKLLRVDFIDAISNIIFEYIPARTRFMYYMYSDLKRRWLILNSKVMDLAVKISDDHIKNAIFAINGNHLKAISINNSKNEWKENPRLLDFSLSVYQNDVLLRERRAFIAARTWEKEDNITSVCFSTTSLIVFLLFALLTYLNNANNSSVIIGLMIPLGLLLVCCCKTMSKVCCGVEELIIESWNEYAFNTPSNRYSNLTTELTKRAASLGKNEKEFNSNFIQQQYMANRYTFFRRFIHDLPKARDLINLKSDDVQEVEATLALYHEEYRRRYHSPNTDYAMNARL